MSRVAPTAEEQAQLRYPCIRVPSRGPQERAVFDCRAKPGDWCTKSPGRWATHLHAPRFYAWRLELLGGNQP